MSMPLRTNDSATKSAPISTATSRSAMSFSVIAGQRGPGVRDVDALVGQQRAGGEGARDDAVLADALGHEPRHAVADDDLRAIGDETAEVVEGDADGVGVGDVAVAAEDDPVARLQPALDRVGREADLRALQIEQQADGAAGPLGGGAQLDRAAAQVLVRPVRAVDARAVHAGCDELVEYPGPVGGRPQRGDDLGAAGVHALSVAPARPGDVRPRFQRLSERLVGRSSNSQKRALRTPGWRSISSRTWRSRSAPRVRPGSRTRPWRSTGARRRGSATSRRG